MRLVTEQDAFLSDFALLVQEAHKLGFEVTAGELLRTKEQQQIYFATGKSKTMDSKHLRKLAGDLNFFKDRELVGTRAEMLPLGEFWESLHPANRWGGNFHGFFDGGHFERNV